MPEPRLARRELGKRLRTLRRDVGLTQEDVVADVDMSVYTLQRIENGQTAVKTGHVLTLCRRYRTGPEVTDALVALAEETRGKGLWEDSGVVPDWFGLYLGLEQSARQIEAWDPDLVGGLLQTEEYAAAVILGMEPGLDRDTVAHRVQVRMHRQTSALEQASITALLGAGALEMKVGSWEIMRRQLEHLRSLAERPNIFVGVVPWDAGPRAALSPYTILSFDDPQDPDIAYIELDSGALYLERERELAIYRRSFARLYEQSVPVKEYTVNDTNPTPWVKAEASGSQGQCVEMRRHGAAVEVRDSKNPEGAVLSYTSAEFAAWISGAKNGEFDHLIS
jgi:transcriptional regulator with XRE-family HTH domain